MNEHFTEALHELEQYGISQHDAYLIDFIPLIEMIWADGIKQKAEVDILYQFAHEHIERINKLAGCEVLSMSHTYQFIDRFLSERPDPKLLKTLRNLITKIRLNSSNKKINEAVKESILATCLSIGASATREYPYGLTERFEASERNCFFEILNNLEQNQN